MNEIANKLQVLSGSLKDMAEVDTYGIINQGNELLLQYQVELEKLSKNCEGRIEELEEALSGIVSRYVANLGNANAEFIATISAEHPANKMNYFERGQDSVWSMFDKARLALSKGGGGWL